jgi:type IV pilus assembly PilO-like protein
VNRRAPLIAAIGMFLLVLIVVFVAILPKMKEVSTRRDELAQEQENEQFLIAKRNRLLAARDQLPEVRRRLAKFNQRVPATADLPGLIRLVQNAADTSNLFFFSIAPGAPVPAAGPVVALPATPPPTEGGTEVPPPTAPSVDALIVPASVVAIGGFFELDQFLFRLETMPRAAKVVKLTIAEGPDAGEIPGQISATIELQVFTTDENAGPGAAPETTGGVPVPAATTPAPTLTTTPPPTTGSPTSPAPTTTGG